MEKIKEDNIKIGKNTVIESTAKIHGIDGHAKNIEIGDNVYIGERVQIICDEFKLGHSCPK